jgi:hypothetical protein
MVTDRNKLAGLRAINGSRIPVIGATWAPLRPAELPAELADQGFMDAWVNERCAAFRALRDTDLFRVPDPTAEAARLAAGGDPAGEPASRPGQLMHLMVIPRGADLAWEELQQVKDQLAAAGGDGVELFPAATRRVDCGPQRHLWVLPPGVAWPVGFVPAAAAAGQPTVPEAALLFWVVGAAEAIPEIWDDAAEAEAAYAARGAAPPAGAAVRLDALPSHGVRSERAAARAGAVQAHLRAIAERVEPPVAPADLGQAVADGAAARAAEREANAHECASDPADPFSAEARDAAWLAAERARVVGAPAASSDTTPEADVPT